MKIQLVSDLHLEFSPLTIFNEGADVLILSGDICVASYLSKSEASPKAKVAQEFRQFFQHVSHEFDNVIYVMGNHEHYHGNFEQTSNILRAMLPSNITLLDNEHIDLDGYRFIGGTLWTRISNPVTEYQVEDGLNDFKLIKKSEPIYRKFRVHDANLQHEKFLNYIHNNLIDNTIIVGHHAPSFQSVSPEFISGKYSHLNAAYCTELHEFITVRSEQIKLWTHGHVHSSHDYLIGSTRIIANPRGYNTENRSFNPGFIVSL